jgi:hypothetical protein
MPPSRWERRETSVVPRGALAWRLGGGGAGVAAGSLTVTVECSIALLRATRASRSRSYSESDMGAIPQTRGPSGGAL